ncbi:hypothetical protein SKAU_G00410100 [Synaphobranchus kaupii]|uniref:Integrase catalytic domain-containing protein n=1 Tax=Synaphobranchus kaupii TaxID=118154 RepID=A0A9Q1IBN5_SYNKA|nr:hypothetical protein SKAU_G00410100 [Synaphobranchus kaupii]
MQHRAGRYHGNADALSRRPCAALGCRYCQRQEDRSQSERMVAAVQTTDNGEGWLPLTTPQLKQQQEADETLALVRDWLETERHPEWTEVTARGPEVLSYHSQWGNFKLHNGLAYKRVRFYWPGCRRDVELHVHCCDSCTAWKGPAQRSHAPLQQYLVGAPMERVAVDILGPFPVTDSSNRYVLVAMDYFTKWPKAYAVPDQSASTTAEKLVEEMFARFGAPAELHSDQGRNFKSQVFGEVCRRLGLSKTRTTLLYSQSDGLVEGFNRTLATQLAILTSQHQRDWDYRTAVQESSQCMPAALMFGRELRTLVDLVFGAPPEPEIAGGKRWTTSGG